MRLPKRLPPYLTAELELAREISGERVLEGRMERFKGRVVFQFTTASDTQFTTMDCMLCYDKGERCVMERTAAHIRRLDVLRREVLAS